MVTVVVVIVISCIIFTRTELLCQYCNSILSPRVKQRNLPTPTSELRNSLSSRAQMRFLIKIGLRDTEKQNKSQEFVQIFICCWLAGWLTGGRINFVS